MPSGMWDLSFPNQEFNLGPRPASWENYMQVRKQQLELDMEQQIGSK